MLPTTTTWRSHGQFSDPAAPEAPPSHRVSTLDHVYVSDVSGINPVATVLPDSTTDHRPVMVDIDYVSNRKATVELKRRNFKSINPSQFEAALSAWGWAAIHRLTDVDKAVKYLNDGVMAALDVAAPLRIIHVRHGKNVYLAADTIAVMRQRDMASGAEYRYLRNRVAALVRRDKLKRNTSTLEQAKARGDSRMLWELAGVALGKQRPTLPKSIKMSDGNTLTEGATAAATRMNEYDVEKVLKLRERNVGCRAPHTSWPEKSAEFSFSFCNAAGISKVIKALGNTGAVGNDHVPIAVYKKGSNILPQPISQIINTSLRSVPGPSTFKLGIIIPIYKVNGKNRALASSYRPVSLLPALSKVLEVVAKEALEKHLSKINAIPDTHFGFHEGRSCSMALAVAQGAS
jgi:hypothetical protein